ncbi:MAG: hypothetical protein Q9P14_00955 [candidate division KSB1 bacterium]|nr:hypothetical protein [candidate division KSB1 bacterium]
MPAYQSTGADSIVIPDINVVLLADSTLSQLSDTLAVIDIAVAGHYRIRVQTWYNSGDEQLNESFFLRVIGPDGQTEWPTDPNAGPHKVVADIPGPPQTRWRDAGRFYLKRGRNAIVAQHYITIANSFPQYWHEPVNMPESVFLKSLVLTFDPTIDGAVALTGRAPRKQWINGDSVGVFLEGETYSLQVQVINTKRDSLRQSLLKLSYPSILQYLEAADLAPSDSGGILVWRLPTLGPFDSLGIRVQFQVADSLPSGITPIDHLARLQAPGDVEPRNDMAELHFAARAAAATGPTPGIRTANLMVQLQLLNPAAVDSDSSLQVHSGNRIEYRIRLINAGPDSAQKPVLRAAFPAWFNDQHWSLPPDAVQPDSTLWQLANMAAGDTVIIAFSAQLPACPEMAPIAFTTVVDAIAENDCRPEDNRASVTAILQPPVYDLAATLRTAADTTAIFNGRPVQAIFVREGHFVDFVIRHLSGGASCDLHAELSIPAGIAFSALPAPFVERDGRLQADFQTLAAGDSLQFRFGFQLPDSLSEPLLLHFRARVQSRFDAKADNDTSAFSLLILPRPAPQATALDLAVHLTAEADTAVLVDGRPTPAVHPGEAFDLRLHIHNFGPNPADSFAAVLHVPAPLQLLRAADALLAETPDFKRYRWAWPSLETDSSITLNLRAMLLQTDDLPAKPLWLTARIESPQDTLTNNNRDSTAVASLPTPTYWPDLALEQWVQTDSFTVVRGDTLWLAAPGGDYLTALVVRNLGRSPAVDIRLSMHWTSGLQWQFADPAAAMSDADSAEWRLPVLLPDEAIFVQARFRIPENLALGIHVFEHLAQVTVGNEPDNRKLNNTDRDSVIVSVSHTLPPPLIEASPPVVSVGDSIVLRVQVPVSIVDWDLWVYYANGDIDSTFADAFFETTRPIPQIWYQVEPLFRDTRLTTEAKEEELVFELRIQDDLGFRNAARASVRIRSANVFTLDRNVFNPTREDRMALRFKLSSRRTARLDLFDLSGQHITKIAEGVFEPDWNTYLWDGRTETGQEVGSGVYIVLLRSGEFESWKKVIIVR